MKQIPYKDIMKCRTLTEFGEEETGGENDRRKKSSHLRKSI